MASDLVQRLRSVNNEQSPYANLLVMGWCHEAAEKIESIAEQIYDSIPKWQANDMQARIEALERVFEAAENVCIAHGMGWDLDGVLGILNDNVRRARAILGDAKEVRDGE